MKSAIVGAEISSMPPNAIKLYGQMDNTCGLASLLMILQPESNDMVDYLTRWWGGVKNVTKAAESKQAELNWERVLNYILLKSLKHPRLRSYIEERLGDEEIGSFLLFEERIQQGFHRICAREGPRGMFLKQNFETNSAVCDPLLQGHLNLMKLDYELKILYHLLGGQFQHHYESIEPTGALKFTREEVKDSSCREFQEKIKILEDAIQSHNPILLGQTHHWMAVKTIKSFEGSSSEGGDSSVPRRNYFVYVLDPQVKQEKTIPFPRLNENYLFYIFKHDETQFLEGLKMLDEVLAEELLRDAEVFRRFVAREIGDEESLKKALVEDLGAWPLPEVAPQESVEEAGEVELGDRASEAAGALTSNGSSVEAPLPTEEEMKQRLRLAIQKAFSDYSKI